MGFEGNLQSSVLKYLNSLPGCKAENVSGNANQSGRPDINGCYHGRMFKIELKTPDNKNEATRKQRLELRKWANVGCAVAVSYSLSFIRSMFEDGIWDSTCDDICERVDNTSGCRSWYIIPQLEENVWQV